MIPPRPPVPALANDKKGHNNNNNLANTGGAGLQPFPLIGQAVTHHQAQHHLGMNTAPGMMMMLGGGSHPPQQQFLFQQMPSFAPGMIPPRPQQQMEFVPGALRWNNPPSTAAAAGMSGVHPKFVAPQPGGGQPGAVPRHPHHPMMVPQWLQQQQHMHHFAMPSFVPSAQQAMLQQHFAATMSAAAAAAAASGGLAAPKPSSFEEPFRIDGPLLAAAGKEDPMSKPKVAPRRSVKKHRKQTSSSSDEEDEDEDESEEEEEDVSDKDGDGKRRVKSGDMAKADEELDDDGDEEEEDEETDGSSSSSSASSKRKNQQRASGTLTTTKKRPATKKKSSKKKHPITTSASSSSMTAFSNRPRRAVQEMKPVNLLAGDTEYADDAGPSPSSSSSSTADFNGEQRLAIEFESLGEFTNPPERLGKKGVIPDGLCGSFIMYAERWHFQVRFLPVNEDPSAMRSKHEQDSLSKYRRIEWRIKNDMWKEYHTVGETYEDALKRNMRGVSLCNRAFTDAMEMRAKEFERLLREERAKPEPDTAHLAFLEARVGVFRPKRFSEGPLLFGLRHKCVQRPPSSSQPPRQTPPAVVVDPAFAPPTTSGTES